MKELFVKCPSCGVVLGVKNSRNEAVKKIICPQCKQQMSVSFENDIQTSDNARKPLGALYYGEMRIPLQEGLNSADFPGSQYVVVNVVRLANGDSKCIVQSLVDDDSVKINRNVLQKNDKVVLAKGDKLEIKHIVLYYDKPYSLPVDLPKHDFPTPKKNKWLFLILCGLIAFIVVTILLWPKQKVEPVSKPNDDTIIVSEPKRESKEIKVTLPASKKATDGAKPYSTKVKSELSDYDLQRYALQGNAEAQLQLGRKLVKRHESNNVILGLNYLHQASLHGSTEAGKIWHQAVKKLQQRVEANDSAAMYILMTIDQ